MRLKKFAFCALAAAAVLGCSFAACTPEEGGETQQGGEQVAYAGTLSKEGYSSIDSAISAYIQNEIGEGASVSGSADGGLLTAEELGQLGLDSSFTGQLGDCRTYTVDYAFGGANYSRSVYILPAGDEIYYFDPIPATGQMLSKSYYNAVAGYENYINCTITQKVTSIARSGGVMARSTVDNVIKIDGDECYYEYVMSMGGQTASQYMYLREDASGITAYTSSDGDEWWEYNDPLVLTDGTVIEKISDLVNICKYDSTTLIKTDSGFMLNSAEVEKLAAPTLEQLPQSVFNDGSVECGVQGGIVTSLSGRTEATYTVSDIDYELKVLTDCSITDFGTTTVDVQIGEYV